MVAVFCGEEQNTLRDRLMVGLAPLEGAILVRIQVSQSYQKTLVSASVFWYIA